MCAKRVQFSSQIGAVTMHCDDVSYFWPTPWLRTAFQLKIKNILLVFLLGWWIFKPICYSIMCQMHRLINVLHPCNPGCLFGRNRVTRKLWYGCAFTVIHVLWRDCECSTTLLHLLNSCHISSVLLYLVWRAVQQHCPCISNQIWRACYGQISADEGSQRGQR